jgi:hypothetical protein
MMESPSASGSNARFRAGLDTHPTELAFGNDVVLNGTTVLGGFRDAIPALGADLLEIATVAYAVDRIVRRPRDREAEKLGGWGRDLWVEVPVREPALWRRRQDDLATLLHWLTDDRWEFNLTPAADPLTRAKGFCSIRCLLAFRLFSSLGAWTPRAVSTSIYQKGTLLR